MSALKPGWRCDDATEQSPKCRAFSGTGEDSAVGASASA